VLPKKACISSFNVKGKYTAVKEPINTASTTTFVSIVDYYVTESGVSDVRDDEPPKTRAGNSRI